MNAVQVGPFYINWSLLSVLVSAVSAYAVIFFILRRTAWKQSGIPDLLINALLLGIAGWKLAPFLFDPPLIWRAPMKGLLMQGGDVEAVIGFAAAILYLGHRMYRSSVSLQVVADLLAYGGAVFIAVRAIVGGWVYGAQTSLPWGIAVNDPELAYHPVNAYKLLLAVMILILFRWRKINIGEGLAAQTMLVYGGAGLFAISLTAASDRASFVLTGRQWVAISMTAAGLLWPRLRILWEIAQKGGVKVTTNDSKAQQEHERENKQSAQRESAEPGTREFDKKLDGPNRPAE